MAVQMIKIENLETYGLRRALYGMRQPMQSHYKSDTTEDKIGEKDLDLANRLAKAGTEHRKFARQIFVSFDVTAPTYWYLEMDTYKIGTCSNSTSKMHKLTSRPLTMNDFSTDGCTVAQKNCIKMVMYALNVDIECYQKNQTPSLWRGILQSLPMSYNQTRTVTMNYEVVANIIKQRKHHKLQEWRDFCEYMVENLPYFKEIFADTEVMA